MLLSATAVGNNPREGVDFFPLTVDVEERMYAWAGFPARSSAVKAAPARVRSSPRA